MVDISYINCGFNEILSITTEAAQSNTTTVSKMAKSYIILAIFVIFQIAQTYSATTDLVSSFPLPNGLTVNNVYNVLQDVANAANGITSNIAEKISQSTPVFNGLQNILNKLLDDVRSFKPCLNLVDFGTSYFDRVANAYYNCNVKELVSANATIVKLDDTISKVLNNLKQDIPNISKCGSNIFSLNVLTCITNTWVGESKELAGLFTELYDQFLDLIVLYTDYWNCVQTSASVSQSTVNNLTNDAQQCVLAFVSTIVV